MNDKWEARSDRLHMREYSLGLGSLSTGLVDPYWRYKVPHHVWKKLSGSTQLWPLA